MPAIVFGMEPAATKQEKKQKPNLIWKRVQKEK